MLKAGFLFAGIGGFELAALWAGFKPVWSNEFDPYCCEVLRKNFTHKIIEDDIRNIGNGRKEELSTVDIICGGFPCQPFSNAGKRKGTDDDRYLWPEMLRIIRERHPRWIVGENVSGLISMDNGAVLEQICTSLESEGYTVQPFIIPACATGAPHRRDRVWIIAHCNDILQRGESISRGLSEEMSETKRTKQWKERHDVLGKRSRAMPCHGIEVSSDSKRKGLERWSGSKENKREASIREQCSLGVTGYSSEILWEEHWYEVAARICRVDDGVPGRMDEAGQVPKQKKEKGRQQRISGLGNAVVPQVVYEIFKGIIAYENLRT